jgi:hypothetical protein
MKTGVLFAAALLTAGTAPFAVHGADTEISTSLRDLTLTDQRVQEAAWRLVKANRLHCSTPVLGTGMILHDIRQYRDPEAARATFGFASDILVLTVAPDSPASAAGLRPGDAIAAINNRSLASFGGASSEPSFNRIAEIRRWTDEQAATGQLVIRYTRDGVVSETRLTPEQVCPSVFQLTTERSREANADGSLVSISTAMVAVIGDENELAAILAHELAHNLLRHQERLELARKKQGDLAALGSSIARIKATEIEADRLSVWLMANAGYDPLASVRFWTRYGQSHGKGIFSAPTHYRWKKRVALLENEIAAMSAAPVENGLKRPPLL